MYIKYRLQAPSVTAPTRGAWMPGCRSVYVLACVCSFALMAQTNSCTAPDIYCLLLRKSVAPWSPAVMTALSD